MDISNYKELIRQHFTNKKVITELDKLHTPPDLEITEFYLTDKNIGLVCFNIDNKLYATKFSKSRIQADKSGRLKPIICDFCFTRLPGARSVRINFEKDGGRHTFSWLVCGELECSKNVRELTLLSMESKKLIGENISVERKIERLTEHLRFIVNTLNLTPVEELG